MPFFGYAIQTLQKERDKLICEIEDYEGRPYDLYVESRRWTLRELGQAILTLERAQGELNDNQSST